jgi:putative phage-type endonuclease
MNQIIEVSLWKLYKNIPKDIIDQISDETLAKYIIDINNIKYDIEEISKRINTLRSYRVQLDILNNMPKIQQRTDEWYKMRQDRLTASDTAQALGKGKFGNKQQLLQKKVNESTNASSSSRYSSKIPALRHGVIYESMALRCYQQRYGDIDVHEFGLIPHPNLYCYGASPDGITDLGIMIEIKCPLSRIIDGTIPEQYRLQMMGQMAVCNLNECDYIECDIKEYTNIEEYLSEIPDNSIQDHGIVIEVDNIYIYSPINYTKKQLLEWLEQEQLIYKENIKICPWKLRKIEIQRIIFDNDLWEEIVPKIKDFWEEVIELKKNKTKKYAILDDD